MIAVKKMVKYQKSLKNLIHYKISVRKKIGKSLEIGGKKEKVETMERV